MIGNLGGISFRHDLHTELPLRKVAALDSFVEVALMALAVLADQGFGFGIGQVPDPLLRLEMELDPIALVIGVDEAEGVAAEAVHVAISRRNAPVTHDDGDLVQRFRQRGPEVPVVLRAA